MNWQWQFLPFGGSGASFGDNPFFDWVRVICMCLGVVLLFATGRVLVEANRRAVPMPVTQQARFVGAAVLVVSACGTEFAVLGTVATPRLLINVVGVALMAYGTYGARKKQRATPVVDHPLS